MTRLAATWLTICFLSVSLLFSTGGPVLAQEEKGESQIEELRKQNEALKKEIEVLRRMLEEFNAEKPRVAVTTEETVGIEPGGEGPMRTQVIRSVPAVSQPRVEVRAEHMTILLPKTGMVEAMKWELENVTLSHGDAGLETMLRFEKAKVCRKSGMLDKAVEELKKIIEQNLSDVTTHAARLTLVEILQEQKKNREAVAELEKIMATATDARSKRDAMYGIINLSSDDPESKIETINRLLEKLREKSSLKEEPPAKF